MSAKGKFFAIGKPQWEQACQLGINVAVTLLVLAMGTGHDNRTTAWSAKAVESRAGIGWRRARDAINTLITAGILVMVKKGARPRYKIKLPDDSDQLIWLPSELESWPRLFGQFFALLSDLSALLFV